VIASAAANPTPVATTATSTATTKSQRRETPRLRNRPRLPSLRRNERTAYGPAIETWYPATFSAAGFGLTDTFTELSAVSPSVGIV
jgi:hypothetical protein